MASVYYRSSVSYGLTFGNALAIAISWSQDHSVLWAIIDGFFSWLYVLFYLLFRA
jgi:tRNA threonylcarbamoyladenosine modification (KEOPS) complex  Pcc1 subunit